ncbi:hypothetical protein [Pseudomonas sp. JV414]|uniref:hypothetical protein n=1 Tax=Pseudomonas sp. JV414 TaxID=1733110 RepID=UPI0028F41FC0|nr:hypothetical protein [Pseudomonas sp. JV414]
MIRTQTRLWFSDARLTTDNRAPNLSPTLCCGALEPWRGSEYSPRPPESGLKKSANLIPDQKANLPRLWTVPRHPEMTLNRLFSNSRTGVFFFSKALAQLLLTALKLTDWMIFYSSKKRRHTRAPTLEK